MVTQEANCASFNEAMQQPVEMVKDYPFSSMIVVFGTGIALGVVISHVLVESATPRPSYFNASQFAGLADRLSRQFQDAVQQVLPDSIRQRMQG